jgi:hypothetical protein
VIGSSLTVIAIPFIVEAYVKLEPNTKASRNLCILISFFHKADILPKK